MNFVFNDEQLQLRDTVRRFLESVSPTSEVRKLMDTLDGFERSTWQTLTQELGLGGIHVPTEYGGAGLSYIELCIVLEEMGRALFMGPFLSTTLAINTVMLFGSKEQQSHLIPGLTSGERIGTVAVAERSDEWIPMQPKTRVSDDGMLTGQKLYVTDGSVTDDLFVFASDSHNETNFYRVKRSTDGVEVEPKTGLDPTRKIATVTFRDAASEKLKTKHTARMDTFLDLTVIALANEMVGGAQRMLDSAVEYSLSRVQFGRSIASLQAIKHKCADLLTQLEHAKSAAYAAAEVADFEQESHFSAYASAAKAAANDAYMQAVSDCIQIHGGIGFTWENDTHLWYKRAKSSEVFWGDATLHRERFLQHWSA